MAQIVLYGLGLIGRQRLSALSYLGFGQDSITVFEPKGVADSDPFQENARITSNLSELDDLDPNFIIISTPHDVSVDILSSFENPQAKILIEKPLGRNLSEASRIYDQQSHSSLSVGFNYRFMPGIRKLKSAIEAGDLGELIDITMQLGHGGAPGDETTWKLDPLSAGGGVILDPGIHLVDLLVYLLGIQIEDIVILGVNTWAGFWNTGIDESATVIGSARNIPFTIKISIVQWKTNFKIEVSGSEKYMIVEGRGRSDGPQLVKSGKRWAWLEGKPQIESEVIETVAIKDESLFMETEAWILGSSEVCSAGDALLGMKVYDEIIGWGKH